MSSIPASALVSVNPSVISAGGTGLDLSGLILTQNTRIPIGSVLSFPPGLAVSDYFGPGTETDDAAVYFSGFTNSNIKPGALLMAQWNQVPVAAYLRGGELPLTLTQLKALAAGTLIVTVEGVTQTSSSINFATATSFSDAASKIQTAFGAYDAITSSATTVAAGAATSVTGSIAGYTLTVSAVGSGALVVGGVLSGTGVTAGTAITGQLTGTTGGVGTYTVSAAQTVSSTTITQSYGLMTVAAMVSGTLAVGQAVTGGTMAAGTTITALGSGTGGAGTYVTSGGSQTVSATTVSAGLFTCVYDSVSGAFVLTGGTPGAAGSITFATGTLATSLMLTSATGAVISQGAAVVSASTFMNSIIAQTTNWASFMTNFDPDAGYGNAVKVQLATWNGQQNDKFEYVAADTDVTPTLSTSATSSLGYLLNASQTSGTFVIYDPTASHLAAFVCGVNASIDFTQANGRITLAYKSQSGITPSVTNQTIAANLEANHYNYYGAWATANDEFVGLAKGTVSGAFVWADSYVDQIWLNSQFQLAMMTLLFNVKSIPYNDQGYSLIRASCMDPINQALNFGVFAPGVQLSALQIAEVNAAAGLPIDRTLFAQGWYLQVLPATAQTRGTRSSPPMTFWYTDAGSVQRLNLSSVEVQ